MKCGECPHQAFIAPNDDIMEKHLRGGDGRSGDFVAGLYPLLQDETCWFLAADFDKEGWADDARALLDTCHAKGIAAALERSRSGSGGHVWIFFAEPVPARIARQFGSALLTETMERCPEIGFASYDRFFPNQDTIPLGGFGNLIALPLQRKAREVGNSVFVDKDLRPQSPPTSSHGHAGDAPIRRPLDELISKLKCNCNGRGSTCVRRTKLPDSSSSAYLIIVRSRAKAADSLRETYAEGIANHHV